MDNLKTLILGSRNRKDKEHQRQGHMCIIAPAHSPLTQVHTDPLWPLLRLWYLQGDRRVRLLGVTKHYFFT